uniref:Uncharacterized protein n=1 Tax=Anguilla anguilla TaxID=7936 RepID=A0A0E9RQW4_ANGAN
MGPSFSLKASRRQTYRNCHSTQL